MENVKMNGREYYSRRHPRGYGWQIMEKTPIPSEEYMANYKCLFHSNDKGLVATLFKLFEGGEVVKNFPEHEEPHCPEKILVHKTKHHEAYYSVPTLESLEKTMRHILVQEYTGQIEHMKPEDMVHNDSGVESLEEIETIPVEKVREEVRLKWNDYMQEVKSNAKYTMEWVNLKMVLDGGGHVFSAMEAFEYDQYECENLRTV